MVHRKVTYAWLSEFFARKKHALIILAIPAAAATLATVTWGNFLRSLDAKERLAITEAHSRTDALARNYAERLARTIEGMDRVVRHIRYDWVVSKGTARLEGANAAGVLPRDAVARISIFDEKGSRLTSSHPQLAHPTITDRPFFLFHKEVSTDMLLVGPPVYSRASREEVILFSRRLSLAEDKFNGVVVASIRPEYLVANYTEATFGNRGFLGVQGLDRQLRVSRIGKSVTAVPAEKPVMSFAPEAGSEQGKAILDAHWFSDHRSRFVSWHRVPNNQLYAFVGLDEEDELAAFRTERGTAVTNALWNSLALLVITLLSMGFAHVLLKRKFDIESARLAYREATEEGADGFYINRPVRDRSGQIIDFIVADCNSRGAALVGLVRDELIGKRLSTLYAGYQLEEALNRLLEAYHVGRYESEVEVTTLYKVNATWVHFKAVRSGGNLAVTLRDISESKAYLQELERRGNEDALTGLPNRHWIQNYLPTALSHAEQASSILALLFVDIDGFKAVNDALGHSAGDDLLKMVASRLKGVVNPSNFVVRLGGDEYVLILEGLNTDQEAREVAERVLGVFREPFHLPDGQHLIGASIGVSLFPRDGIDAGTLLKNSDIAMYAVKKSGKGNYQFYEPHFYEALKSRLSQEMELCQAIEDDEFEMYYQPRVNIKDGSTSSMEALVRWNHPTRGLVGPVDFIPLAEATGQILSLGTLIIEKVCQQLSVWQGFGQTMVPVSINVSPRQFADSDVPAIIETALRRHNVAPHWVQIELTESMMMGESGPEAEALAALREMGILLCLDDFGTGYSSLSQLQRLDFDVLKIDMSFTAKLGNEEGRVLVCAMIMMAHALGMKVVAEGVETESQMQALAELGCDEAQGYFISRPLPAAALLPV